MSVLNLFKNQELKLVEKKRQFSDKYYFVFKATTPLSWKAGQHGIFSFKGEKLKGRNFRVFSVASSPHEEIIMVGTRIGENASEFKERLKTMAIGDTIFLRGPFGNFYLPNEDQNMALIAGGIGITPMRSILKAFRRKNSQSKATLFYIDSQKEYVFQEEFIKMDNEQDQIDTHFLDNRAAFKDTLSKYIQHHENNSLYFISGRPKMVKDISSQLQEKGIKKENIVTDSFRGYK